MQNIFIFTPAETILFTTGCLEALLAVGLTLFALFRKRQKQEEQRSRWESQPRMIRSIRFSLLPFLIALDMIIDAFLMRSHPNFLIIFLVTFLEILLIAVAGFFIALVLSS